MIDIAVRDLKKEYEVGQPVLDGLTFQVDTGERVGILGRNGAGKTTLFRILTGQEEADSGEVILSPGKRLGLISQIPVYPAGYTVEDVLRTAFDDLKAMEAELHQISDQLGSGDKDLLARYDRLQAAYEAGGGYEIETRLEKICAGLGIERAFRDKNFADLSGGEKTRINLARLILVDTEILLLDEPTNHLDLNATVWLEDYISHYKGTVLVISHDRYFLDRTISRVVELKNGRAEFYAGNYSFYAVEKERRYLEQLRQYKKEQAEIQRLSETARIMHEHNTEHLNKRAFSIEKRIARLNQTARPEERKKLKAKFGQAEFHADDLLSLREVNKAFGSQVLFDHVTLRVEDGDRIALLGDNGAGKSTLLKIILGEEPQDGGTVKQGLTVKVGYLPQQIRFSHPERSLYDTMLYEAGCNAQQARDRLGKFLFQGEDVFKPVSVLSGGEQSRLRLCMLMDEKVNFLILDEPTNHLDLQATEWLEDYLRNFRGTVVTISHDRYFLDRTVTRIIEIQDGKAEFYSGNYSFYAIEKERRYQERMKQYLKEQAKIQQLEKAAEQMHLWAFMGNDALHKRAFSMEKRIERMRTTRKPTKARRLEARFQSREFKGDEVLQIKGISKSFGERRLFEDVYLRVEGGERIALLGENGTGKTTLLNMIVGLDWPDTGMIRLGPSVKAAYLPQVIHFDHPERSILDTMLYELDITPQSARNRLAAYQFTGEDVFKSVSVLSGGELSRLRLCMLMDESINLLILDEPTNHLDIDSREWLEQAVEDFDGTLLFVSHDRYFINRFATRVWELEDRAVTDYPMGFMQYRQVREEARRAAPPAAVPAQPKKPAPVGRGSRSRQAARKQLTICETAISRLEASVAALDRDMEAAACDAEKLGELYRQRQEVESQLEQEMTRWEELSLQLEEQEN